MPEFIFMLTRDDQTVPDALEVYRQVEDIPGLRYVGFKDIGLPVPQLKQLAEAIHRGGQTVMLEVVSLSEEDELTSARAAVEIGADYLLGGKRAEQVLSILASSGIKYFPFCGETVGHPTQLRGSMDEIVADAIRLAGIPGVDGLDLLAYRFDGDVARLVNAVAAAVSVPVIAAGSIDGFERIDAVSRADVWGFTVGSAIFESRFAAGPLRTQLRSILGAASRT